MGSSCACPSFLRVGVCCCALCCSLAICGVVAQAAIANSIATLRHYIGGFTACADAVCLAFSPCFLTSPCSQPPIVCSLHRLAGGLLRRARRAKRLLWKNQRTGRFLLASVLRAASLAAKYIGLSTAQRRNGAPLTPSPRRLVVGPASNAAVRPHKLSSLLPESMLSRADVSYSRSNHTHNSADHA